MKPILAVLLPVLFVLAVRAARGEPDAQNDLERAALQEESVLQSALHHGDSGTAGKLLTPDFAWTDEYGHTANRSQFVRNLGSSAAQKTAYSNVRARSYGQLVLVTGTSTSPESSSFFARVWIKRPSAWLFLSQITPNTWLLSLHQSTPMRAKAPEQNSPVPSDNAATACDNPCRSVPYNPHTATEADVVKAYQAVETAVTVHDAKTWGYYVADEFVGVGRVYAGEPDTKQERVHQIANSTAPVALPKMLRLKVLVFGNSALMIADHQPIGEKPYRVIRLWVNRDGRWQLFHRQETTIQ